MRSGPLGDGVRAPSPAQQLMQRDRGREHAFAAILIGDRIFEAPAARRVQAFDQRG
jgi:hypothetical protein